MYSNFWHLDWLEKYGTDNAIRSLAANIVSTFAKFSDSPFFNDPRMLRVCLTVGRVSRNVGFKGVMQQISDRGQFAQMPEFYIRWAEIHGIEKDRSEFERIYCLAIERKAKPQETLVNAFRDMRQKYFGVMDDAVEDNTRMIFFPRKLEKENIGANGEKSLLMPGDKSSRKYHPMHDFSNLPVPMLQATAHSANNSNAFSRVDIVSGEAPKVSNVQVNVDEEMDLAEEEAEISQKKIASAMEICSPEVEDGHQRRYGCENVEASNVLLNDNRVVFKTPNCTKTQEGSLLYSNAVDTSNAGKHVQFEKNGLKATFPAVSSSAVLQGFPVLQEKVNNSEVIFPTSRNLTTEKPNVFAKNGVDNVVVMGSSEFNGAVSRVEVKNASNKLSSGVSLINGVNALTIDDPDEEEDERTGVGLKSFIQSVVNPWDNQIRLQIMERNPLYPIYLHDCLTRMRPLAPKMSAIFEGENFEVLELIGQGGFAKVFKCDSENGNTYAVKWVMGGVMSIRDAYIHPNMSAIVYDYYQYGNLLELTNSFASFKKTCSGLLCVYLGWEIARIMREVHKAKIIHADVKPDNFMLMRKLNENASPDSVLSEKCFTLKLIDWGRAIDMSAFKGRTFSGRAGTDCFDCVEMMDGRPWTYQTDFFGFIGTLHVLLFGEYMKTTRNEVTKQYRLLSVIKRRCNQREVLQEVFETCLNIQNCENLPDWTKMVDSFDEAIRCSLENDCMEWKTGVRDFNKAINLICEKK